MGTSGKIIAAVTVLLAALALVLPAWWLVDRPFGGATCWVNYRTNTFEQAIELQSMLSSDGLDASVSGLENKQPPARPVVTVEGGFWKTEDSLRTQVLNGVAEIGAGNFDQCRTPRLGD